MASGIVKDIDEKFCQCIICLEQFKEPKLLPCLHRFCKHCLAEMIKQNQGYVACPVCREKCIIPNEGLDGFKTDFYMKNIIEYIQFQTSLEENHMQECYSCSKTLKVSAYCFKCNDFLCESCHQFHLTSKVTKDHRPHTLAVEDVVSKRLTLDKLASLKEAPRCCTHSEKLSELCCKTCRNTPICMACTYGHHDGHDFREVTALAIEERQILKQELAELLSYEDKILKVPPRLKKITDEIETIVLEKKKFVQAELVDKKAKIDEKLQDLETKYKLTKEEEEGKLNQELSLLQQEMEKELQKIREKYNKLYDEKRQEVNKILEISKKEHEEKVLKLREKFSVLNTGCNEATESLLRQQQENIKKAQAMDDQFESMIKRFENMKATTSTLLESMNDWTVVQCSADILMAKKHLIEEMRKEIPELDTLTEIEMKPLPYISLNNGVFITNQAESVVNIGLIIQKKWKVCDITTTQTKRIIITGNAGRGKSYISVIDITGKVILKRVLPSSNYEYPDHYCDFLSGSDFVTACDQGQLGKCDTEGMIYSNKNVREVTNKWPPQHAVTCVASDNKNNQFVLGNHRCRHLYVFDSQFNFRRKLALPNQLIGCHDVVISGGNLIVCGFNSKIAIAMNMESRVVCEFKKPGYDSRGWKPMDACTDSKGFVYILWCNGLYDYSGDHVITQNTVESKHDVISVIPVDKDAFCVTTMELHGKERLLVATRNTGKIFSYNLVPEE